MTERTLLAAVVSLALAVSSAFAADAAWTESYAKAAAESKKSGRPILVNFTGSDWCGWCIKLHKEVFSTKEFNDWAKDNVVLLTIDFPQSKKQTKEVKKQNKDLEAKYKIEGYPTILILDAGGKKLGELGYMEGGPKPWIAEAAKVVPKSNR